MGFDATCMGEIIAREQRPKAAELRSAWTGECARPHTSGFLDFARNDKIFLAG